MYKRQAQSTREVGVRLALGATTGELYRLVLWRGLKLVGVGLAVGLVVSSLFRRPALRHALLSYVFGGVVIAATVTLVAGLGTSPGAAHSPRSGPPCAPAT